MSCTQSEHCNHHVSPENGATNSLSEHQHLHPARWLHEWLTVEKAAKYLLPFLPAGKIKVLDVGCGNGILTRNLAAHISGGFTTGIDSNETLISEAKRDSAASNDITFVVGDALNLPFADNSFDVVHTHQVLHHVKDPVKALKEMRRVTKKGGLVAARDLDVEGYMFYPEDPGLYEWVNWLSQLLREHGGEPNAGRRLKSWALKAGFSNEEITTSASFWCFSSEEERKAWIATWAEPKSVAQIWQKWNESKDAWLAIPHGEVICRVT